MKEPSTSVTILDRISDTAGAFAALLTFVMVLVAAFNALARYAGPLAGLHLSSNAYLELQWYLFSAVFLLGGAATLRADAHVRVDVFYRRLSRRRRLVIDFLGSLFLLLPFSIFMIIVSWPSVANSWSVLEGSPDPDGLPRYPVKTLVPLGFVLLLLQGISIAVSSIKALRNDFSHELEPPPRQDEGLGHAR